MINKTRAYFSKNITWLQKFGIVPQVTRRFQFKKVVLTCINYGAKDFFILFKSVCLKWRKNRLLSFQELFQLQGEKRLSDYVVYM